MYLPLANSILACYRSSFAAEECKRLNRYSLSEWKKTLRWIDATGIALTLSEYLKVASAERYLPSSIVDRLERNVADNRERTHDALCELQRVQSALKAHGVRALVLKGFSLVPHSCAHPALRLQLDIDLGVAVRDATACQEALESLGYTLFSAGKESWEFKTRLDEMPSISDLYRTKLQRCIDIHLWPDETAQCWFRKSQLQSVDEVVFDALDSVTQFVQQAFHVYKHMRSEWVRVSWLIEFRNHVVFRQSDEAFWTMVRELCEGDLNTSQALGAAVLHARAVLGAFSIHPSLQTSVDAVGDEMALWIDEYALRSVLSEFPGSKLYLLQPQMTNVVSSALPLRRPPAVVLPSETDRWRRKVTCYRTQLYFVLVRFRFHLRAGLQYLLERRRWKLLMARTGGVS